MSAPLQSFGRVFAPARAVMNHDEAVRRLRSGRTKPGAMLAFGNGRSYGDSCLNAQGAIADMRGMNRLISFDPKTGLLEAEAGMMLDAVIALGAPHGYFPAVVPGTRFVTLGGAIANDVHGKNHHRRGTFGRHVVSLTLLRSDGRIYNCSRNANPALFAATVGGMGLSGLILTATIRLMPVGSQDVVEKTTRFGSLGDYFDVAEAADEENEYAVAWVDQLAPKRHEGRGLLFTGNHAEEGGGSTRATGKRLGVPFQPPLNVLNRPFLKVFNLAYRSAKGAAGERRAGWEGFFFPLDGVRDWNRLYGPNGLFQHQSVVPEEAARTAIPEMFAAARKAGQGSFLTVLKRFGDAASPGILSFPCRGYTLTLDFPNRGAATLRLLSELDRITIGVGGAVNPYKDARMSAESFAASFPRWRELEALRDPAFVSDFWRRTALQLGEAAPLAAAAE